MATPSQTSQTSRTSPAPRFVRMANVLTKTLLRAGLKLRASGHIPAYLLTVRGRKSGLPRTVPIVVIEQDNRRYLVSPFGIVDWVRNLRAAGEGILTRGRRSETVRATELPINEAGPVLQRMLQDGIPSFLVKYFEVTPESSPDDFARTAMRHPVFLLQRIA